MTLGLTDEEYDFMPSDKYDAMVLEWLVRDRARYAPAAQIASILHNVHRGKGRKPAKPEDFMPADPTVPKDKKKHGGAVALRAIVAAQFNEWKRKSGNG